jgi:hypothetical protein
MVSVSEIFGTLLISISPELNWLAAALTTISAVSPVESDIIKIPANDYSNSITSVPFSAISKNNLAIFVLVTLPMTSNFFFSLRVDKAFNYRQAVNFVLYNFFDHCHNGFFGKSSDNIRHPRHDHTDRYLVNICLP